MLLRFNLIMGLISLARTEIQQNNQIVNVDKSFDNNQNYLPKKEAYLPLGKTQLGDDQKYYIILNAKLPISKTKRESFLDYILLPRVAPPSYSMNGGELFPKKPKSILENFSNSEMNTKKVTKERKKKRPKLVGENDKLFHHLIANEYEYTTIRTIANNFVIKLKNKKKTLSNSDETRHGILSHDPLIFNIPYQLKPEPNPLNKLFLPKSTKKKLENSFSDLESNSSQLEPEKFTKSLMSNSKQPTTEALNNQPFQPNKYLIQFSKNFETTSQKNYLTEVPFILPQENHSFNVSNTNPLQEPPNIFNQKPILFSQTANQVLPALYKEQPCRGTSNAVHCVITHKNAGSALLQAMKYMDISILNYPAKVIYDIYNVSNHHYNDPSTVNMIKVDQTYYTNNYQN